MRICSTGGRGRERQRYANFHSTNPRTSAPISGPNIPPTLGGLWTFESGWSVPLWHRYVLELSSRLLASPGQRQQTWGNYPKYMYGLCMQALMFVAFFEPRSKLPKARFPKANHERPTNVSVVEECISQRTWKHFLEKRGGGAGVMDGICFTFIM